MTVCTRKNDRLLVAARGGRTDRTPVWLMRQAGRFDPAYRQLRASCGLPLEDMFRDADLAAEITLLPKRLGVDALILFQDILTPTGPMGAPFVFRPGPVLERPIRCAADIARLHAFDPADDLDYVAREIALIRAATGDELPLLGFAGAPLTVAAFMIEGASPGDELRHTRALMRDEPAVMHRLLDLLSRVTVRYLRLQVESGVEAFQLFESCGNLLTDAEYAAFAHPYQQRVFEAMGDAVPRILFVRDGSELELMVESGADVLSLSSAVELGAARRRVGDRVALQGNVDNHLLMHGTLEDIERAVRSCLAAGGRRGHILNLSHGLLKDTPFEHVCRLLDICRTEGGAPRDDARIGDGAVVREVK